MLQGGVNHENKLSLGNLLATRKCYGFLDLVTPSPLFEDAIAKAVVDLF